MEIVAAVLHLGQVNFTEKNGAICKVTPESINRVETKQHYLVQK